MRCEWKTSRLDSFADIKGGKRLPKGASLQTTQNAHPYIRIRDLGSSKILQLNSSFEYVDDDTQQTISRYIVNSGDILISIVGTIGLVGIVGESLNNANLTENCVKLININGIDSEYLYYYLISPFGQTEIAKGTVGAVQPKLPIKNIQSIMINHPKSIELQKKIASILRSIDAKIELSTAINNNLEQQAQAIFKSWFIDYEPFDGEMPNDWFLGTLGDFVEIKRGGSPRPIQEYLSNNGLRWLKISDATATTAPFILDIKEHIKESGLKKTVFLNAGALVLSNSATPGIPKILDVDSCIHDGWLYFPKSKFGNEYMYLFFKYIRNQLVVLGNGSVFTNLKTDILKNYPTVLPSEKTLFDFDEIIKPIFEQILTLTRENNRLAQLRDTLLPKLMSGELDVTDIDL